METSSFLSQCTKQIELLNQALLVRQKEDARKTSVVSAAATAAAATAKAALLLSGGGTSLKGDYAAGMHSHLTDEFAHQHGVILSLSEHARQVAAAMQAMRQTRTQQLKVPIPGILSSSFFVRYCFQLGL